MKLYRTPSGRWFGTQADARQACLDEAVPGNAWTLIDVPDDKPGRLEWLNRNVGCATVEAFRAEQELDRLREREAAQPQVKPAQVDHGAKAHWDARNLITVEEFIQAAEHAQLSSIISNAIFRLRELAKAANL